MDNAILYNRDVIYGVGIACLVKKTGLNEVWSDWVKIVTLG
jgi:hypothetical protein